MRFTKNSTEQEVREFLERRFGPLIDDKSASGIASLLEKEQNWHITRKGRPRLAERIALFERIRNRPPGKSIGDIIREALDAALVNLSENSGEQETEEAILKAYKRYMRTYHPLLDNDRTYNEQDFCERILAKQFDIAAAIFSIAGTKTKPKITLVLNRSCEHRID